MYCPTKSTSQAIKNDLIKFCQKFAFKKRPTSVFQIFVNLERYFVCKISQVQGKFRYHLKKWWSQRGANLIEWIVLVRKWKGPGVGSKERRTSRAIPSLRSLVRKINFCPLMYKTCLIWIGSFLHEARSVKSAPCELPPSNLSKFLLITAWVLDLIQGQSAAFAMKFLRLRVGF